MRTLLLAAFVAVSLLLGVIASQGGRGTMAPPTSSRITDADVAAFPDRIVDSGFIRLMKFAFQARQCPRSSLPALVRKTH